MIGLVASGSSSIMLNYNNTMSTVERMMSQTAVLAAECAQQELEAYKNVVMEAGCIPQLSDPKVSVEEKQAIIASASIFCTVIVSSVISAIVLPDLLII